MFSFAKLLVCDEAAYEKFIADYDKAVANRGKLKAINIWLTSLIEFNLFRIAYIVEIARVGINPRSIVQIFLSFACKFKCRCTCRWQRRCTSQVFKFLRLLRVVLLTVLLLVMAGSRTGIVCIHIVLLVLEVYGLFGDELWWYGITVVLQVDRSKLATHLGVSLVALGCLFWWKLLQRWLEDGC